MEYLRHFHGNDRSAVHDFAPNQIVIPTVRYLHVHKVTGLQMTIRRNVNHAVDIRSIRRRAAYRDAVFILGLIDQHALYGADLFL